MPEQTVKIAREFDYDVVVCGGGTAGFCAAVAAGRAGAKTAVIERFGVFGGTMTVGGVNAPALFHAHGKRIIGGIGWELMEDLHKRGYATMPPLDQGLRHPQMSVEINAFEAEVAIDRMVKDAGVDIFFHQTVVYCNSGNGHVSSVLINSSEGLIRINGKVFIDCTGDGNVAVMAGADYEISDELQPGSLNSIFMNWGKAADDPEKIVEKFLKDVKTGVLDPHDVWGLYVDALVSGHGRGRGEPAWKNYTINVGNNLNHVYPFNGADSRSRTEGEIEGRKSIARIVHWLNENVQGFENTYIASVSPVVSARESRRIMGNAYITGEEYVRGYCPEDSVCYSFYPIDVHRGSEDAPLDNEYQDEGKVPGIPFGALTAKGFDNLMMAGRIISGDRRAQSAFRVQATCMATGEAAGTAAAMSVKTGVSIDKLDISELREVLKENGMIVPGLE